MGLGYGISWLLSPYSNRSIVGLSIKGLICLYYYIIIKVIQLLLSREYPKYQDFGQVKQPDAHRVLCCFLHFYLRWLRFEG